METKMFGKQLSFSTCKLVTLRLEYIKDLLEDLPGSMTKTYQMIQNVAPQLNFNQPKRSHHTPPDLFDVACFRAAT